MTAAEFNRQDTTAADLKQVEQELADSKIGLEFWWYGGYCPLMWVPIAEDDIPKGVPAGFKTYCEAYRLGWAKLNDRWQLALRYGIEWYNQVLDDGGQFPSHCGVLETSTQPLAQATRTRRVSAAYVLPDFLAAFDDHVREYMKFGGHPE